MGLWRRRSIRALAYRLRRLPYDAITLGIRPDPFGWVLQAWAKDRRLFFREPRALLLSARSCGTPGDRVPLTRTIDDRLATGQNGICNDCLCVVRDGRICSLRTSP